MTDVMLADHPIEQREQTLRESCDQICEKSYNRKFVQNEINERRAELAEVSIKVSELEEELAQVRATIKGKIKPLLERRGKILDELKSGGEWVTTDVYKFVDLDEGVTTFYAPDGHKIEERPITPEERQRNVFQQFRKTGTED